MTESEKALSQFIAFANKHTPKKVDEITSAISEMKKLVDRDVPKKIIMDGPFIREEDSFCPNCKINICLTPTKKPQYCFCCGQSLKRDES